MQTKFDIFISYRRSGGKDLARMIKESLTARGYNVFLDFDGLKDGHFNEKIMKAIDDAPVFILVLSKGSMERCVDENDWVRKEIEYALLKGKQIIPIDPNHEFDGFPDGMTPELKDQLGQHQFSLLDTTQLYRESLDKIVRDRIVPVMANARKKRVRPYIYTILVLVGLFLAGLIYLGSRPLPEVIYQQGMEDLSLATTRSDSIKAFKKVKQAADRGDESAIYTMGAAFYYGQGLEQDYDKALYWFEKAKEAGSVGAYYHLGLMLLYGYGVPKNESKGVEYLEFAGEHGIDYAALAYCELGKHAAEWNEFTKAAQYYHQGLALLENTSDAAACGYELGKLCLTGKGIKKQHYVGLELLYQMGTKYNHFKSLSYLGNLGCRMCFDMSYAIGDELRLIIYGLYITESDIQFVAKFENASLSPQKADSFHKVTFVTPDGRQTYALSDVMSADEDILHTTLNSGETSASFALVCPRFSSDWQSIDICFNEQSSLMLHDIPLTNYTQFGLFVDDVVATDQATILNCSFTTAYPSAGWFSWSPNTYIQPADGYAKLFMVQTEGCAILPEQTRISFGETANFKLYFPNLPSGVSRFDLIEEDGSTFNKYGLSVNL